MTIKPRSQASTSWRLGWGRVLGCFFISVCTLGLANTFGTFQSHYQTTLLSSQTPSTISWIGTTQGFLLNIVGLLSGRLHDLYPRHLTALLVAGSVLNVLGLLAASFSTVYYQIFLSLGVCVGLGSGLVYVPSLAVVAGLDGRGGWIGRERNRPLACGMAATGAGVGGVVYPVLFRGMVGRVGFAWAVRGFAGINVVLLGGACLLVRRIEREVDGLGVLVEEEGGSDGGVGNVVDFFPAKEVGVVSTSTTSIPSSSVEVSSLDKSAAKTKDGHQPKKLIDQTALRDIPFMLFSASLFLLWLGVDIPFFFLPSYSHQKLELPAQWGDHLLAIMNGSAILGRVVLGILAAFTPIYASSYLVWLFSIGISGVLLSCWTVIARSLAGIIVFVVFYGALTGGVISLVSSALLVVSPDVGLVGTRLGMAGVLAGLGFLVGPPIAGALEDKTPGGYLVLSLFAAVTYLAAFGVLCLALWIYRRKEQRERLLPGTERAGATGEVRSLELSQVRLVSVSGCAGESK